MKWRYFLELICRWVTGGVFIYASISKIINPCSFAMDIYHYQILPGVLINISAIILPVVEFIFGIALIIGLFPRGAFLGIIVILCIFIGALSINLVRGIEFECGCFGSAKDLCEELTKWYAESKPDLTAVGRTRIRAGCDILRDILFLVPAVYGFSLSRRRLRNR